MNIDQEYAKAVRLSVEEAESLSDNDYDELLLITTREDRDRYYLQLRQERESAAKLAESMFTRYDHISAMEAGRIIANAIRCNSGWPLMTQSLNFH